MREKSISNLENVMKQAPRVFLWLWLAVLTGCTLFPEKKNPSLKMTPSAEQHERIFWQLVKKQDWNRAIPLLTANAIWTVPGQTLYRDELRAYLEHQQVKEYLLHDAVVKPNGVNMTVLYTLEEVFPDGHVQRFTAVSVWQELKSGWVMILHSQHPQG
jgi:hypothetical protein